LSNENEEEEQLQNPNYGRKAYPSFQAMMADLYAKRSQVKEEGC